MGLRGLEHKSPRDMEKERRGEQEQRSDGQQDLERRSREKVQEILLDQNGDMSAYTGGGAPQRTEREASCELTVEKIMSGRVAVLSFDDTLLTVQGIFNSVKFRHLPVVDDNGNIIGIVSDRDLLRNTSPFFGTVNEQNRDAEIMGRRVGMIMTRNPLCVATDVTVIDAVKIMNRRKISCLPVMQKGTHKLLGIVTWKDIVRAFCPAGFNIASESNRLKTGVYINPESSESVRLRAKAAESVRLRALAEEAPSPPVEPSEKDREPAAPPGHGREAVRRTPSDTEAIERPQAPPPRERSGLSPETKIFSQEKPPGK